MHPEYLNFVPTLITFIKNFYFLLIVIWGVFVHCLMLLLRNTLKCINLRNDEYVKILCHFVIHPFLHSHIYCEPALWALFWYISNTLEPHVPLVTGVYWPLNMWLVRIEMCCKCKIHMRFQKFWKCDIYKIFP